MAHENPHGPGNSGNLDPGLSLSPIQEQQVRLLVEQEQEEITLEAIGIADKAREILRQRYADHAERMSRSDIVMDIDPPEEPVLEGDTVRISVALVREKYSGGVVVEEPAIRFSRLTQTTSGHSMIAHNYVEVGTGNMEGTTGLSNPTYDFTPEELEVVEGMLLKRRHDAESGIFPNLTANLADIADPSTGMMVARPPEENS